MDPFNNNWKEAEKKAFEAALAEIDPNSSDWFEQLITRFPNKTPQQLRDHYMDLVVDMECIKSGNFPSPIYSDPWGVDMATETEHLSGLKLPYSPEFSATESMSSRMGSMSMPEKKAEEEDLSLLPDKGANEETLLEELMRDGFFVPDEWWMKESSHEQMMKQEKPDPEIEGGSEILSPVIAEGDNKGLSLETKGIEIMSPKAVMEVQNGKQIVTEESGVPIGRKAAENPEISASKKGRLWTKEEHRLFLIGMNIYGRGAWKKIATNFVHTRTPTQVASHAQKFFDRQLNPRMKRRHSILDITTIFDVKNPPKTTMHNSVGSSSQTQFNNVRKPSPSSMPLPPLPMVDRSQIVSYPQFSQHTFPNNVQRNNNQLGFR